MKNLLSLFVIFGFFFASNVDTFVVEKANKIRVLTSPDYPPFEFLNDKGKIIGFELDILAEIEKRTGLKFEINKAEFGAIIGALKHNKADVGMSGFTVTEERRKNVDFADYDVVNDIGVLTNQEFLPKNISELRGKKIITQVGTIADAKIRKMNKDMNLNIEIVGLKDNSLAIQMLNAKKVDGFCLEYLVASFFKNQMTNETNFYSLENSISKYGLTIRKDLKEKNLIKNAIKEIVADGTYDRILTKWSFVAESGKKKDKSNLYIDSLKICLGAISTLKICLIASIFALFFSVPISLYRFHRNNKGILSFVISSFISAIRGTPVILQLSLWYFCIPILLKYDITPLEAGILTLMINSTAYISEIIRGGFNALDKGQIEASISLNLSTFQMYKDIILPQLLRNILPMLTSEFIVLIKESAVLSIFGVEEITFRGNVVIGQYYTYILPIVASGITYYTLCFSVERFGKLLERKFSY